MNATQIVLVILCITLITAGQVLLKKAVGSFDEIGGVREVGDVARIVVHALSSPWLWLALVTYGASFVMYMLLLAGLPLGYLYAYFSISFVTVPLVSHFAFGDKLTLEAVLGAMLIVIGVILISRQHS